MPVGFALGATLIYLQYQATAQGSSTRLFGETDMDLYSTLGIVLIVTMTLATAAPRTMRGLAAATIPASAPLFAFTFYTGSNDALLPLVVSGAIVMIGAVLSLGVPQVISMRSRSTKALVREIRGYRAAADAAAA